MAIQDQVIATSRQIERPPSDAIDQSRPVISSEAIVPQSHSFNQPPSQVTVSFGDRAHSFLMHDGATLGELAGRIGVLRKLHVNALVSIHIEFAAPKAISRVPSQPHRPLAH